LFARAIVVEDGGACAVFVVLDLGGAWSQRVGNAVPKASAATGCPAEDFVTTAT